MRCPFCHYQDTKVRDSRSVANGAITKRRRECEKCKVRFTTSEEVSNVHELKIIKKNGKICMFDRQKIAQSIYTALRKRDINTEAVELEINKIIGKLRSSYTKKISTEKIGNMIMESLLNIDPVAYVRFASVYKKFDRPEDFQKIIDELRKTHITCEPNH